MSRAARGFVAFVGVVALLVGAAGPAAAASRPFQAVDLGSLSTTGISTAFAINDKGVIVGTSDAPDGATHGVLWSANGTLRDLGQDIYPADINEDGTIIGTAGVGPNAYGFILRGGTLDEIAPELYPPVFPFKLNDRGQTLLKRSNQPPSLPTYFFRDEHGRVTQFPQNTVLSDLNNLGQVVGTTFNFATTGTDEHGFVWQVHVGVIRNFGPATQGRLINDRGHVVKDEIVYCGDPCRGGYMTFHYLVAHRRQLLISTGFEHTPLAMNERDQVVGSYSTMEGTQGATFFDRKTQLVFLARGDIGPTYFAARDVNERTKIVGESEFPLVPDPGGPQPTPHATLWDQ
jgi:probable HAF family extracellular repeat protein